MEKKNNLDPQYNNLLEDILENGVKKQTRNGDVLSVFGREIRHKMSDGFPILTCKKMFFKGVITELLWFLQGRTDLRYLLENDCNIWTGDAYKRYYYHKDTFGPLTKEQFIEQIKTDDEFSKKWGDLGSIYGKQWRSWNHFIKTGEPTIESVEGGVSVTPQGIECEIDQIANLIKDLKTNPDSRRLMVNAWNVAEIPHMVLPPCHYGFQCYTRELTFKERLDLLGHIKTEDIHEDWFEKYNIPTRALSLKWNQRSVDTPLGLPFNIASYGLLLEILAKEVNMVPDELVGSLGDCHIYLNQIDGVKEQIGREYTVEERLKWMRENTSIKKSINVLQTRKLSDDLSMDDFFEPYNVPKRTREPFPLPKLKMGPIFLANLEHKGFDAAINGTATFELENYQSHPSIKFPLSN